MNLILFTPEETARPLDRRDPRAEHLLRVLRRAPGDTFDAGLIDGPRGKGTLRAIASDTLEIDFAWGEEPPPLPSLALWIGLPRPQTARKILQEATSLGVGELRFFPAEKGEASYAQSTLWSDGEWRRLLIAGAEQAFCTRLPKVTWATPLAGLLAEKTAAKRYALDNYEATVDFAEADREGPLLLAFGSERGWSASERDLLRANGFTLAHLGTRVLRTETAIIASLGLCARR